MRRPILVVVGGLPGVGKSTVAGALVDQTGYTFLRVDRIEHAIISSAELRAALGPVGYMVAYDVAAEQLEHGISVVAECVNPLTVTRDAWRDVAVRHDARLLEVELICSDRTAHRQRVRTREVDIPGLRLPDWQQVMDREYQPWDRDHLIIDTAASTPAAAVDAILAAIPEMPDRVPADRDLPGRRPAAADHLRAVPGPTAPLPVARSPLPAPRCPLPDARSAAPGNLTDPTGLMRTSIAHLYEMSQIIVEHSSLVEEKVVYRPLDVPQSRLFP